MTGWSAKLNRVGDKIMKKQKANLSGGKAGYQPWVFGTFGPDEISVRTKVQERIEARNKHYLKNLQL